MTSKSATAQGGSKVGSVLRDMKLPMNRVVASSISCDIRREIVSFANPGSMARTSFDCNRNSAGIG